jgi:hypothetical protein
MHLSSYFGLCPAQWTEPALFFRPELMLTAPWTSPNRLLGGYKCSGKTDQTGNPPDKSLERLTAQTTSRYIFFRKNNKEEARRVLRQQPC